jgi:hypothetical protein
MDNIEFLEAFNGQKVSILIDGYKGLESYVGELLYLNENKIGLAFKTYQKKKMFIEKIFIDKKILLSIWIY